MTIITCTYEDAFEYEGGRSTVTLCECGAPSTKACAWCEAPVCDICAGKQLDLCMACVRDKWATEEEFESVKDALDRYMNFMGL